MEPEDRYHRFVGWSDQGQCYIGCYPNLDDGGVCHGDQKVSTCAGLRTTVDDEIAHRLAKGETLPSPAFRATCHLDFDFDSVAAA